tara:strand:+ start:524 stop:835 length:312 start_codon:yes stop_codon:yes gene_type:complete
MKKLIKEVREIKRKVSLPIVRKGPRGMIVPPKFSEREKMLLIEMLNRRSKRHPIKNDKGHIFNPMKMHEERVKRGEGHNEKGIFEKSTQRKAMKLIREGKWVV